MRLSGGRVASTAYLQAREFTHPRRSTHLEKEESFQASASRADHQSEDEQASVRHARCARSAVRKST